jgi:hypothetical protein
VSAPRIPAITPAPSAQEAAAIVAAVERFRAETASAVASPGPPQSGWLQAARLEGVTRDPRALTNL